MAARVAASGLALGGSNYRRQGNPWASPPGVTPIGGIDGARARSQPHHTASSVPLDLARSPLPISDEYPPMVVLSPVLTFIGAVRSLGVRVGKPTQGGS